MRQSKRTFLFADERFAFLLAMLLVGIVAMAFIVGIIVAFAFNALLGYFLFFIFVLSLVCVFTQVLWPTDRGD